MLAAYELFTDFYGKNMDLAAIESKIKIVRGQRVLLDCDVASLYHVETKRVNEAVKNNPQKFPTGYVLSLTSEEIESLRSNFSTIETSGRGQHSKYLPKAFTEKGLYMLATILKSPVATRTTIAIIEAFAKFNDFSRTVTELSKAASQEEMRDLAKKSGNLFSQILEDSLTLSDTETTIEVNLAMLKFKHTVKRKK